MRVSRRWLLACCRIWKKEADGRPDGGKAYAAMRILKGMALGYDVLYDRLCQEERDEVRRVIADIAQRYYGDYFTQSSIAGSGFHTHHAIVEWSSFGVAALAVLGEVAHAQMWVEATVTKFQKHLLPMGLAADGAQVEGMTTFWASTMHSRLFFMDALRRVTGKNLFADYAKYMDDRVALATVAGPAPRGLYSEDNQSVIFSPSYAQLDYYSAALLYLAREYRRPLCQRLALWDTRMGAIQRTRYVTPHMRVELLFELGGYNYVWYDPSVTTDCPPDAPMSWSFPSVQAAFARGSYQSVGVVLGLQGGGLNVSVGGATIWSDYGPQSSRPVV